MRKTLLISNRLLCGLPTDEKFVGEQNPKQTPIDLLHHTSMNEEFFRKNADEHSRVLDRTPSKFFPQNDHSESGYARGLMYISHQTYHL